MSSSGARSRRAAGPAKVVTETETCSSPCTTLGPSLRGGTIGEPEASQGPAARHLKDAGRSPRPPPTLNHVWARDYHFRGHRWRPHLEVLHVVEEFTPGVA